MDPTPVDTLARTLYARRTLLGGLAVLLGLVGPDRAAAHTYLARCRRIKNVRSRRACLKKARAHNAAHRRPPRQPNAACSAMSDIPTTFLRGGTNRIAQTFTEPNGGRLAAAQLVVQNRATATGDYELEINTVDPSTGVPTNDTIASTVLPSSQVSTSPTLVTFFFATPPTLVARRQYALVLARPGGAGEHAVSYHSPGTCPGAAAFLSNSLTGSFTAMSGVGGGDADVNYVTFVGP